MYSVKVGQVVSIILPYSEVCMHMRVADLRMPVLIGERSAQLLNASGTPFSSPITYGEAGVRQYGETGISQADDGTRYVFDFAEPQVSLVKPVLGEYQRAEMFGTPYAWTAANL